MYLLHLIQKWHQDNKDAQQQPGQDSLQEVLQAFLQQLQGEMKYYDLKPNFQTSQTIPPPQDAWLTGQVLFFTTQQDKNFGFFKCPDTEPENVYFHKQNLVRFYCNGGNQPAYQYDQSAFHLPRKNEQVIFLLKKNYKGYYAEHWGFPEHFHQAWQDINNRPTYRFYRRSTQTKLWEGQDIDHLRVLYPLKWHLSDPRYDMADYYFQVQQNNQWQDTTTDPRKS